MSVQMILILLVVLILISASNAQEDYCTIQKEICGARSHIRCNMSVDTTTNKFYPGRLITRDEKELIVNSLNEYRAKYKKMAIEWNNEFEYVAKAMLFVSRSTEYCYATKEYSIVFPIDYQIIFGLDRNINKWIECLIETNASILRLTEATQIGCVVYSPNLNDSENPFLHSNYRIFCILNGNFDVDKAPTKMYNTCIQGKRDKIDQPVDYAAYPLLMVKISIWVLLITVFYLIGNIGIVLYIITKNRNCILDYLQNNNANDLF